MEKALHGLLRSREISRALKECSAPKPSTEEWDSTDKATAIVMRNLDKSAMERVNKKFF